MGNPSYNPMDLVRKHSPHPRAMVLVSPGPGSHPQTIPGCMWDDPRNPAKITTLSRNPYTKQFLLRVGEIWYPKVDDYNGTNKLPLH